MKHKTTLLIFPLYLFILSGCAATLEDFQEMSASERTDYVCERHREVKYLTKKVNENYDAITDTEAAIGRGYRLHESCKEVTIIRPDVQECHVVKDELKCVEKDEKETQTVCEDIPVAIDGELEERKLRRYERDYDDFSAQLDRQIAACRAEVKRLGADAAFDYYQSVR